MNNKPNNMIPSGCNNVLFENMTFSFLGITGFEKLKLTETIESKGGEIVKPSSKTKYLIYDLEKGPTFKFWPTAMKREENGSIIMMTPELFFAWTDPGYSLDCLLYDNSNEKLHPLAVHYLNHPTEWKGQKIVMGSLLIQNRVLFLDKIYQSAYAVKTLPLYFDFLTELEEYWKESGDSDGYYVFYLVKTYLEKAIQDKKTELIASLLEYKGTHFDSGFTEAAESHELDIMLGLKKRSRVYYLRTFNKPQKGDEIIIGSYPQSESAASSEPVTWIVLDVKEDKMLVISKYALDFKRYNETDSCVTWETCTIRSWLNSEFLNNVFSETEQSMILTANVTADLDPMFNPDAGKDTKDKVFLLSQTEAWHYSKRNEELKCRPTPYAVSRRGYQDSNNCFWWLRSAGHAGIDTFYVDPGGLIGRGRVHGFSYIRPAVWIDLNS